MKDKLILLGVLFRESFAFAWQSLVLNKLRSFLTLLGVTIGIFSIILVFSIVDSIRYQIEKSISALGTKVLYIQKWPWVFSFNEEFPWWEYIKRPEPTYKEMIFLKQKAETLSRICFFTKTVGTIETQEGDISNVPILGVSENFFEMQNLVLANGRFISRSEFNNAIPVAVIGKKVKEILPSGTKQIRLFKKPVQVIGELMSQGDNPMTSNYDGVVIIPYLFIEEVLDKKNLEQLSSNIAFEGKDNIAKDEMKAEIRSLLRTYRKLPPAAKDNFSINEPSYLQEGITQIFSIVKLAGWLIGGFALLVGGFGIANIMFVSVYERISFIGLQMALGAKRSFIFSQFLLEAIFLSIMGGIVGLAFVFITLLVVSKLFSFSLMLSVGNIMLGLLVATMLGLLAGVTPAWSASKMDPATAIRQI
jgi:putative ABC transport system permease protein